MDTAAIKEEIRKKIDLEENPQILQAIHELLFLQNTDPLYRDKLIERAIKSEDDIIAGRVYTSEEFKTKINESLAKKR